MTKQWPSFVKVLFAATLFFCFANNTKAQQVIDQDASYYQQKAQLAAASQRVAANSGSPLIKAPTMLGKKGTKAGTVVYDASGTPESAARSANYTGNCTLIPRTGAGWTALSRCDDCFQQVALPFTFTFYGQNYNQVYISNNGVLSFAQGVSAYLGTPFPASPSFGPMIAGFWGDIDTRNTAGLTSAGSNQVWYKVEAQRLIVFWDSVGRYSSDNSLRNSFQVIISSQNNLGVGTGTPGSLPNVAIIHGDMNWVLGSAGGSVANVGFDAGDGINFFNQALITPSGTGTSSINSLDSSCSVYRVLSPNFPPKFNSLPTNNLVTVNCGQTTTLNFTVTPPETIQTSNVSVSNISTICGIATNISNNNTSNVSGSITITGLACNVGTNTVTFTATDNDVDEPATATYTLQINVVAPTPTISSVSPLNAVGGTNVTITGTNFGTTGNTVSIGGINMPIVTQTATSIVATLPSGPCNGNIVVRNNCGASSAGFNYTLSVVPSIVSVSPSNAAPGSSVVISGTNFSSFGATVTIGGFNMPIVTQSATSITATLPAGVCNGNIVVRNACGTSSAGFAYTLSVIPTIVNVSPLNANGGASITISGTNFSTSGNVVTIGGINMPIMVQTATSIVAELPYDICGGDIVVTNNCGSASNAVNYTLATVPTIVSISASGSTPGSTLVISGTKFSATGNTVTIGGINMPIVSQSSTSITVTIPVTGLCSGNIVVTNTCGNSSNGFAFTLSLIPNIVSVTPSNAIAGSTVTISGTNFGTSGNSVTIGGVNMPIVTQSATSITATLPSGICNGNIVVTNNCGSSSNGFAYTLSIIPTIVSVSPTNGAPGSTIVISGTNFGSTGNTVTIGGVSMPIVTQSATSITATIPNNVLNGNIVITNNCGTSSSGFAYTVNVPLATALHFDGINDRVNFGNPALTNITTQSLTLQASVYPTGIGSGGSAGDGGIIINKEGEYEIARWGDGTLRYALANSSPAWNWINTGYVLPLNTWSDISLVYNRSTNQILTFVNGVQVHSTTGLGDIGDAALEDELWIGGRSILGGTQFFTGIIDEVRIWNRALCGGEINVNRSCELSGPQAGLVAYYKLNHGYVNFNNAGTITATDASGNNYNGTLVNFALTGTTSNWTNGTVTGTCSNFIAPTATITAGGPTTFCVGGSVTLTASAGLSYLWSNGATSQSIVVTTAGNYSVTVRDASGCAATSASVTVVVNPNPVPVINANGPTTFCAGGSVTLTASSGSSYLWSNGATTQSITASTAGSYNVTVTNSFNCAAASAATVVTVNPLPTITCPGNITVNATTGQCGAIVNYPAATATGIPTPSITYSKASGTLFSVGTTTVTATASNSCGTVSCTFTVTVVDNQNPTISCPSNININATSAAGAVVTYTTPVGTDNCSGSTTTRTAGLASGSTFPIGTTTVTHVVTDAAGLTATCSFTVTVTGLAPQIVCPSNITVNNTPGVCGANVSFTATESTAIPASTITYSHQPGSFFPVGTTTVTATATNAVGSSSCTFTVTVVDNQAPVVVCASNISVNADENMCSSNIIVPSPQVIDNCNASALLGNGLAFNGNSYIDLNNLNFISAGSGKYTIEMWVKMNSYNPEYTYLFGDEQNANEGILFEISPDGYITTFHPNTGRVSSTNIQVPLNTWTHIALVQDGSTVQSYVNGISDAILLTGASLHVETVNATNVGRFPLGGRFLDGKMDELRIWSLARNAAQLSANKNIELTGSESGLYAYYNFNQGIAGGLNPGVTNLVDAAPADGNNNGTLIDFSLSGNTSNWVDGVSVAGLTVINSFNNTSNASGTYPVGTTNVTWSAIDAAGNTQSCTFTVTVVDNQPPVLVGVPANATVECDAVPAAATVTASDNCTTSAVSYTETRTNGDCPSRYTLTRTWSTTDASNNTTTATQTITVQDTQAPVISAAPADVTVSCDAVQEPATLTAVDNCDAEPVVTFNQVSTRNADVNNAAHYNYTITRTWTATDACGNASSKTQVITVQDITNPTITCPANRTVNCQDDNTSSATGVATATDNCSPVAITQSQTSTQSADINNPAHYNYVITRTWRATDVSGNFSECVQTITVQDVTNPTITCPANRTVNCQDDNTSSATGVATATDNCSPVTITQSQTSTQSADVNNAAHYNYVITRTWRATDVSGNFSECVQTITVQDITNPTITCPASVTVNCQDDNTSSATGVATATDNCSPVAITQSQTSTQSADVNNAAHYNYVITRTWRATDVSGNFSECVQTITVQDITNPTITCPASVTVNCQDDNTSSATGVATATDNCSPVAITQTQASTQSADINNPAHYNYVITRTWRATDVSGNFSECVQTITVQDVTNPTITCPASVTVNCQDDNTSAATGVATATDNCSPVTITQSQTSTQSADVNNAAHYNYTITRTWRATDVSGNFSECVQTITVQDITNPTITCPASVTVNCQDDNTSSATGVATATDNCSPVAITQSQTSTQSADINNPAHYNYVITRTWRATDVSGNFSECVQTITVQDITNPTITCPANRTVNCQDDNTSSATGVATATDNCSPVTITQSQTSTQSADVNNAAHYNYVITRTWRATDVSGNFSECVQTITVQDVTNPTITCPANRTVNCQDDNTSSATGVATATDNCSPVAITQSQTSTQSADINNPAHYNYVITRTWRATDVSGNFSECVQTITVQDVTNPTITCPASVTVNCQDDNTSSATGVATATDNCSPVAITQSQTSTQNADINNPAHYNYVITRTWRATDVSGNFSECVQTITVQDVTNPVITTCPTVAESCNDLAGNSRTATLVATDNCSPVTVSYTLSGATTKATPTVSATATENYNIGTTTINWTVRDVTGNTITCTTTVVIRPLPVVSYVTTDANAFCNKLTLTASSTLSGPYSYAWSYNNAPFATTASIQLDNANGDGNYSVYSFDGFGCRSAVPAVYNYQKQNIISNYTILAYKEVEMKEYSDVQSGSVGVMRSSGEAEFKKYSAMTGGAGTFVKAPQIKVESGASVPNRILGVATVSLPTMQVNTFTNQQINALPSFTVNQFVTVTLNGNYKSLNIRKGANVTLNGTVFGKIDIEEGATVRFTQTTLNISDLKVGKGPNNGSTAVKFADNTSVRVSKQVKVEEDCYINPDGNKVTFYLGDEKCDEEKFQVKGGNTTVIANIYAPSGKIKVTGGSKCHSHHSCGGNNNNNCSEVNMIGLFIAEEVESQGKNVDWNGYSCSGSEIPTYTKAVYDMEEQPEATTLQVKVAPNPSLHDFVIRVESKQQGPINIKVTDAQGKVLTVINKVAVGSAIPVGGSYTSGIYFAEIMQGTERKVVRLVKGN